MHRRHNVPVRGRWGTFRIQPSADLRRSGRDSKITTSGRNDGREREGPGGAVSHVSHSFGGRDLDDAPIVRFHHFVALNCRYPLARRLSLDQIRRAPSCNETIPYHCRPGRGLTGMETPAGSVGLPRFRLRTLGGLRLTTAELEATALDDRRKWLAILAFLAADTNGGVSRDRVLATFWPESDTDRARNALNQAVFGIRRALGDDALLGSANELRINPLVVDVDLHRLRRAVDAERLADAIAEYEGPFLDGVFLRDVPEFERWVESSRRACAVRYCTAIETLATSALATGDHATAIRYARLLANADTVNA